MRLNFKNLSGSIRAVFSVIGSVIGAGFITGREIMRFFYGKSLVLSGIFLFAVFFCVFYFLFLNHSELVQKIINKINTLIIAFNFIIIASMMSATDSLFNTVLGLNKKTFIFSVVLLLISIVVCLNGIKKLGKVNAVLVPLMLVVLFLVIFFAPLSENVKSQTFPKLSNLLGYVCMNCLLAQPLIVQIKKEEKISPFLVAFFASLILSVCVVAYLLVLNDDCRVCDIPLLTIVGNYSLTKFIVIPIIFAGIITTQFGAFYPIISALKNKKQCVLGIIVVSLLCFVISRLGFYQIVDYVYPIIAVISILYFLALIPISLISFVKVKLKRTLSKQEYRAKRC